MFVKQRVIYLLIICLMLSTLSMQTYAQSDEEIIVTPFDITKMTETNPSSRQEANPVPAKEGVPSQRELVNTKTTNHDVMSRTTSETKANAVNRARFSNRIIIHNRKDVVTPRTSVKDQVGQLSRMTGLSMRHLRTMSNDAHIIQLSKLVDIHTSTSLLNIIAQHPDVEFAEFDAWMFPSIEPNDPYYTNDMLWGLNNTWGIRAPSAWNYTTSDASVTVAVIDTGITSHSDLDANILPGYDFISINYWCSNWVYDSIDNTYYCNDEDVISGPYMANDGDARDNNPSDPGDYITGAENIDPNGYFYGCGYWEENPDNPGYYRPSDQLYPSSWHGTHVAGTIGAVGNNNNGVTGVAYNTSILPVRVLGKCGGYTSDIVDGMLWAAGFSVPDVPDNPNPAQVLNLSLGGYGACPYNGAYQLAIDQITAAGKTVVVAAGNNDDNSNKYSPASCYDVISVAATGFYGQITSYSNYGSLISISAPGGGVVWTGTENVYVPIYSTLNSGTSTPGSEDYAGYQGTSMATPHVAGIVALMYSIDPDIRYRSAKDTIRGTATRFPSGHNFCLLAGLCGSGIANANKSIEALLTIPKSLSKSLPRNNGIVTTSDAILTWQPSAGATNYDICIATSIRGCTNWTSMEDYTAAYTTGLSNNTTYYWQIRAKNSNGRTIANSGTHWRFTVRYQPFKFNKMTPANNATNQRTSVTLKWNSSAYAVSYEYCISTNKAACTSWRNVGINRQVTVSGLARNKAYYWQVRAKNTNGTTIANGDIWKFTTAR